MSEESKQTLASSSETLENEEAQCRTADKVQIQPTETVEIEKNMVVETADTNTPALTREESSAESESETIDTPFTGKPAEFDEAINAESETKLLQSKSAVINDEAEEPLEVNTEGAVLEVPNVLHEPDEEAMDSDDKDQEAIAPIGISNDALEDSLENITAMDSEDKDQEAIVPSEISNEALEDSLENITAMDSEDKDLEAIVPSEISNEALEVSVQNIPAKDSDDMDQEVITPNEISNEAAEGSSQNISAMDSEDRDQVTIVPNQISNEAEGSLQNIPAIDGEDREQEAIVPNEISNETQEDSLQNIRAMDSEDTDQETIVPNEVSNEPPEDALENIPMNTEESAIIPEIEELEIDSKETCEVLEDTADASPMQTDELPLVPECIKLNEDPVESLSVTENDKSSVGEPVSANLLLKKCSVSDQQTTSESHQKDNIGLGDETVGSIRSLEEVVTLDLRSEDTAAEDNMEESLNKKKEIKEFPVLTSKSDQQKKGENIETPSAELEKQSLSPTAKEINQKIETLDEALDKNEPQNISDDKGDDSEVKTPAAVPSNIVTDTGDKQVSTEQSKGLEATEDIPEESLETMDTCDSQESTNLIIDETSDIAESRDANESQSKEDTDEAMDTADKKSESEQKDIDIKSTKTNEGEQEKDKISVEVKEIKDDKVIQKIQNKNEETAPIDDAKDDDVIPIEQPPMPIIEIDDDDDDDVPSVMKSPLKESKQQEEKSMDIDEGLPQEISNKTTTPMEISSSKETSNTNNELLTVTSEKTMDEVVKEDENKINSADNEDTTTEVFYKKECINYECCHKHKQYFRVPQFAYSYFKVNKKKFKVQYICADCYDKALEMFEEYCGLINAKQPLLMENIPSGRQEFVEIIDSSDEEDGLESAKIAEPNKPAFSKNDLSLIERELHTTIKSVLERVEIQNQLTWSKTILAERLKRLEMETEYVDNELRSLQRKADKMHEGLYSCPKIKIRQLQPLDLNSGKIMGYENQHQEVLPIPPVGEIERPAIQTNGIYFAVKNNAIASWVPCKVVDQVEGGVTAQKNVKYYRIKFIKSQHQMLKTVPAKYLSYYEPPAVRLPIGTRVIAYFDATSLARGREKMNVQSAFYPGIIAEPLKPNNKFRYLIFYDDGYTQYVYHKDVRLVCHVSENVWEDVHPASRDFIQKYLTQYSINRPMVQTQKGQSMNTESNGYWLHARVVDIDCSLVLMQFEGSKSHTEWIYRGSLRLGPVFKEYQKTLQKNSSIPVSRLPRRTEPFIRYTEDEESSSQQQQQAEKTNEGNRAVARKSFGRPESLMNNTSQSSSNSQKEQSANTPAVKHLNNSTIYVEDENKPKGKVVYYTAKRNLPPRKYIPHMCSPGCLFEITHNLSAYSPLSKPLLSGWERFIIRQKIKKVVTYRAPCGKIFRNMKELHHYLRVTKNTLNVDNFDFSPDTNCLAEYVIESAIVQKRDISCGQEKMAIPLVNYYDSTLPPECKYSAKVIPTEGVHINKDPEFFAGCDCDDDCSDKSKCSCWQLTVAGAKYGNPNSSIEEVGYQYKRLLEHVPTGIYECNPRCKCKQNCLNRVVQHSLQLKLQVFKTSNRGWGLRCINDVPRGTFVCVYAGHLLTEAKANEGGQDAGDEYFAELDYIEVAEQIKEGYESEVEPPEPEDEDAYQPELDDDDFTPSKSFLTRSKRQSATKSTRPGNQEDDSQERQVINFNPNADMNEDSVRESSIRTLYGKDEACYVMDAKISGNLGRYFNHSCAPNMFVQNVFVDTHDLRFPWVAFFSSCNIRAGTELTWNYNYEVGVVPGKVLYCQCGAPTCRLRLL